MSIRVDSSPLFSGAVVVGVPGLGVLAEDVPSTGEYGAGYAYPSLEFPADNGKEIRGLITTWPTLGTLTAFEDTSFEYDGSSDTFAFQLYVDGVAVGTPQTVTITIGLVQRRAIVITADGFFVLPVGQEGTGLKPLVLVGGGSLQERVESEGVPIIWDGVTLRTLDPATEVLVI